jgi:hypothetical protein
MDTTYRSDIYDGLPEILPSYQRLALRKAIPFIETTIRQVFVEHHVEGIFGVRLLHRHFDLSKTERMVQYGAVATPWTDDVISNAEKCGIVQPSNWIFRDSVAYPYEFIYRPVTTDAERLDTSQYSDFLIAYYEALKENQLLDILGLALKDESDQSPKFMVEICLEQERAAVNFPAHSGTKVIDGPLPDGAEDMDITVPAAWFFYLPDPTKIDGCGGSFHCYSHCRTHK